MKTLFKFLFCIVVIIALIAITPYGQQLKARVIDVINPAAAGRRNLADLKKNLNTISSTINKSSFQNLSTAEKTKQLNSLLKETTTLVNIAEQTAAKSDFTAAIGTGINTLIQKIIPSDRSTTTSTQPSPNTCPQP